MAVAGVGQADMAADKHGIARFIGLRVAVKCDLFGPY